MTKVADTRPRRFWLKLAAGLLFAVVAYGGTYLATMSTFDIISYHGAVPVEQPPPFKKVAAYPHSAAELLFRPAHWIDRTIRPEFWGEADPLQIHEVWIAPE